MIVVTLAGVRITGQSRILSDPLLPALVVVSFRPYNAAGLVGLPNKGPRVSVCRLRLDWRGHARTYEEAYRPRCTCCRVRARGRRLQQQGRHHEQWTGIL